MLSGLLALPGAYESVAVDTSTSRGVALTSHATVGTDGAWTELIASSAFPYTALHLGMTRATVAANYLVDIGIGAGGSEKILLPSIPFHSVSSSFLRSAVLSFRAPIVVPGGSRIAARVRRATAASSALDLCATGESNGPPDLVALQKALMYGTDLANARGTVIDPSSANTETGKVELAASTGDPIRKLFLFAMRRDTSLQTADNHWLIRLYVGAAGSEKLLVPPVNMCFGASPDCEGPNCWGPYTVNLPAGVRLSATAQASSVTNGLAEIAVSVLGFC